MTQESPEAYFHCGPMYSEENKTRSTMKNKTRKFIQFSLKKKNQVHVVFKKLLREDLKLAVNRINFVTVGKPFHVIAAEYKKEAFPILVLTLHGTKFVALPLVEYLCTSLTFEK